MIKNGIVENIAIWDGITVWNPTGYTLIDITTTNMNVNIGWLYNSDTQVFSAPPPPPPED